MGVRAQILVTVVVVVALAIQPSVQQSGISELVTRCRANVGEQAAVDLANTLTKLMRCTKYQDLYTEVMTAIRMGGVKEALKNICRRKGDLLTCFDQAYESIKRCLEDKEKKGSDLLHQSIGLSMDFTCEHVDDIATIIASPDEHNCLQHLESDFQECFIQHTGMEEEYDPARDIIDNLESTDEQCKKSEGIWECTTKKTSRCKNSISIRLFSDMVKEVVLEGICGKTSSSGAASLLDLVGPMSRPLHCLISALVAPYFLGL